ncbi:hypothetical protein BDZ89DRAFT_1068767 [Hymenopellis radicata]|nr:hypothetical protein BDZ89DRAFT_1068767 [Hymenopellis radicata]
MIHAMLGFNASVCTWHDTLQDEARAVVAQLYTETSNRIVFFLRVLGGRFSNDLPAAQHISRIRNLFCGTLQVASMTFSLNTTYTFPVCFVLNVNTCFTTEPKSQSDTDMTMIKLENASVVYNFLCHALQVWSTFLQHPSPVQWYIQDFAPQLAQLARMLFDHLLSTACPLEASPRIRLLLMVLRQTESLRQLTGLHRPIFDWNYLLLRHRLKGAGLAGWEAVDMYLIEAFQSQSFLSPSAEDFVDILNALESCSVQTTVSDLGFRFVCASIQHLDFSIIAAARDQIGRINFGERSGVLTEVLNQRINPQSTASSLTPTQALSQESWRVSAKAALQVMLQPEEIDWMEDDQDFDDERYMQRILNDATSKLTRRESKSAEWRMDMIRKVQTLMSALAPSCLLSALPLYSAFMKTMLGGTDNEATAEVRRQAFKCSSRIISRALFDADETSIDGFKAIFSGLTDANRSVRLAAGDALKAMIICVSRVPASGKSSTLLDDVFNRLHAIIDAATITCKETLTISIGMTGETDNKTVLGFVLCFLIAQLRRPNIILTAQAACQILTLTKYHQKKTPWPLLSPHMELLAPYLIFQEPQLLAETCRLMNVTPREFFTRTQRYTLPHIMMKGDSQLLRQVARELEMPPARLILEELPRILGHIFMMESSANCTKALGFTTDFLRREAPDADGINVGSLVKGFINQLLGHLVVIMGDENDQTVQQAQTAIKRVAKTLTSPAKPGRSQTTPDLGTFLAPYMLVLMSYLNDMLQAVQGKINAATKRKVLRSLGVLIKLVGSRIISSAPQIMATLQTNVTVEGVSGVTLEVWNDFLRALEPEESPAYFGTTSATLIYLWPSFSAPLREAAMSPLDYMINKVGRNVQGALNDVVDFSHIPDLEKLYNQLQRRRGERPPEMVLNNILQRVESPNYVMASQSLVDLKTFMLNHKVFMYGLTSGDTFNPLVGKILVVLFSSSSRDGDGAEPLRLLAFECFGILGAVDPDRTYIPTTEIQTVLLTNFADEEESITFAVRLIEKLLVDAFRSTSDTKYQGYLAYGIQELLKFCAFTPSLVLGNGSASLKVRKRWKELPQHIHETVTPFLGARFTVKTPQPPHTTHPLYPDKSTYRDWIQLWTTYLISQVKNATAKKIFSVLQPAVHNSDVVVAHHLLPHLVLHNLISGDDQVVENIRVELIVVLEDQVNPHSSSSSDKRLLSAQVVFMLLDHLNKWVRKIRQELSKRSEGSRKGGNNDTLVRVDSILSSINQDLMAQAAYQSKSYARALMNFERQVDTLKKTSGNRARLAASYDRLHEMYAQLDEPDGMEGVSAMILSPSLEHQIRQHESLGRWTSAQSCWEVRLQESPDNLEYHLGLLRCLRNLGHYDTLATHVRGVLTRHPLWSSALAGFQVESAWMVSAWDDVQKIVAEHDDSQDPELVIARVLLAVRGGDESAVRQTLSAARLALGAPIVTGGGGYRRSYHSVLNLHVTHELEAIHNAMLGLRQPQSQTQKRRELSKFSDFLQGRLEATLPSFRTREPILSMRRTAFRLFPTNEHAVTETANTWLTSVKIARKAGQWQTAYSALLQAKQGHATYSFMESSKLTKATGEPHRALQELENSMHLEGFIPDGDTEIVDLTEDESDHVVVKAKAQVLRSRWASETQRNDEKTICAMLTQATDIRPKWESGHFRLGHYQDECFKALKARSRDKDAPTKLRLLKMNVVTIQCFAQAVKYGSKYVYQTIPRLLSLYFSATKFAQNLATILEADQKGQQKIVDRLLAKKEEADRLNSKKKQPSASQIREEQERQAAESEVQRIASLRSHAIRGERHLQEAFLDAAKTAPAYQWYTVFPQIVSRVGASTGNDAGYKSLVVRILEEYPAQAIWLFISATRSTTEIRRKKAHELLLRVTGNASVPQKVKDVINECQTMAKELLDMCELQIPLNRLNMSTHFPELKTCAGPNAKTIVPLQESLTAVLPPSSAKHDSVHNPFPKELPTFLSFLDDIEVMSSLAKPKKISLKASNGQTYSFLGKPKDDLRKDARLMDFNSVINKLLNSNSESRRRQLHIRTYGVVTLNEECGFIQWVPNTGTLRPIIAKYYATDPSTAFGVKGTADELKDGIFEKILATHKPVLQNWFLETFPEPTALGDRHCENILLDVNTGDVVHVDFNCLFEKGKLLETPERVPFRLTQNIIGGLGVTGVEGVFRVSCELTFDILRQNKDPLTSVLDSFLHDPLQEFMDEKNRRQRRMKQSISTEDVARTPLDEIAKKLMGIYVTSSVLENRTKQMSTKNLVQVLILEASSLSNLARMYVGWAPWM